jgi:hypothetical protein
VIDAKDILRYEGLFMVVVIMSVVVTVFFVTVYFC